MRQPFPRCNLPSRKRQPRKQQLTLPPQKLTHPCAGCGEESAYCVHKRKSGRYYCENCYRKMSVVQIAHKKQWLWDHKASEGCVLCGEDDPRCLDYHHEQPDKKKFSIGSVSSSIPTHAIRIEMKKCVVICANCHRKVEVALKM